MLSSDDTPPLKPRSRLLPILCSFLAMAGVILLLVQLGKWTRERVSSLDRYTVSFADIQCPQPPTQDRSQFLGEVQYLGNLPDQLHLLDVDLAKRLANAFAQHPWVEKVEEVKILPPKQVQVRLVYRTPVLTVVVVAPASRGRQPSEWRNSAGKPPEWRAGGREPPEFGENTYQVDGHGVLLRGPVFAENLPLFETAKPPARPAGTCWGDPAVEAAARTAGFLRSYQDRLPVQIIEGGADDLVLKGNFAGRILWGRPPGAELPGEATAAQKVLRLLDYCSHHDGLGKKDQPCEHDVRPKGQALHRILHRAEKGSP